jgi:plastocyanin
VRRTLLIGILGACLVVGVLPALAADQEVKVADFSFTPSQVAVKPGESVTWRNMGSTFNHNVHFEGEAVGEPTPPSNDFTVGPRTFPTPGEYRYFCDVHPNSMRGTVYVNESGTVPTPSPSPSPSPTVTPTSTPGGGGSGGAGGGSGGTGPTGSAGTVVTRFRAAPTRDHFCTRRGPTCRRPGVFLSLDLGASAPVRLRGTLRRRPLAGGRERRFGTVAFTVRPGRRRVKLPGRRLTPGRYVLDLRAGDIKRRLRFRVRPS